MEPRATRPRSALGLFVYWLRLKVGARVCRTVCLGFLIVWAVLLASPSFCGRPDPAPKSLHSFVPIACTSLEPGVERSPKWIADAERVMHQASIFETRTTGLGGGFHPSVRSYATLVAHRDRPALARNLSGSATLVGRLYGACGLLALDPDAPDALAFLRDLRNRDQGAIESGEGCVLYARPASWWATPPSQLPELSEWDISGADG